MCLGVEEDRDWEVDPCVPKMKEELLTKLLKLYVGHVKIRVAGLRSLTGKQ